MRKKPKADWHNFDYQEERRLGKIFATVRWKRNVLETFLKFAVERFNKNTGIRFKVNAQPKQYFLTRGQTNFYHLELNATNSYIFPNVSKHTGRYDSYYNRLETYLPINESLSLDSDLSSLGEVDVAFSVNANVLKKIIPSFIETYKLGAGIGFSLKADGATEKVNKYCGEYLSFQLFSQRSIVFDIFPSQSAESKYTFLVEESKFKELSLEDVLG